MSQVIEIAVRVGDMMQKVAVTREALKASVIPTKDLLGTMVMKALMEIDQAKVPR